MPFGAPTPLPTAIALVGTRTVKLVCIVLPNQAATAPQKQHLPSKPRCVTFSFSLGPICTSRLQLDCPSVTSWAYAGIFAGEVRF